VSFGGRPQHPQAAVVPVSKEPPRRSRPDRNRPGPGL